MPFSGLADSEDFLVEAANTPAKLRMPLDAGAKFCDKGCDPLLELKEEKFRKIAIPFEICFFLLYSPEGILSGEAGFCHQLSDIGRLVLLL